VQALADRCRSGPIVEAAQHEDATEGLAHELCSLQRDGARGTPTQTLLGRTVPVGFLSWTPLCMFGEPWNARTLSTKKKPASSDALARTMVPGQVHTGMDSYTTSAVNPCLDSCAPSSEVPLDGAHKLWLGGLLHPIIVVCRRWWAGQQPLKPASFSQRRGPSGNSHLVVLSFCSGQVDYCVPSKEYY
jgi:hypothetical protein